MPKRIGALCILLVLATASAACNAGTDPPASSADRSTTPGEGQVDPKEQRGGSGEGESVETEEVVDPAPDFAVETFEGQTFSLAEQRGTPVVLNFWESW
jgi:AhpC/TSA family